MLNNIYRCRLVGSIERPTGATIAANEVSERALAGMLHAAGDRPTLIEIESAGGSFDEAQAMASRLALHALQGGSAATRTRSICGSGAILVFAAAGQRIAGPAAVFEFHGIAFGDRGVPDPERATAARLRQWAQHLDALDRFYAEFVGHQCGIDPAIVAGWKSAEATLTADEALRHGLVHAIDYASDQEDLRWTA